MPTISIEVPEKVTRRDIRIELKALDDRTAMLLLSLVLEKTLSPSEEEIREIAERVEEAAWKKLRKRLQP